MNNVYTPDCWVVVRFRSPQYGVVNKILAGWGGGYTQGTSWKLNSGITKVEDKGEYYLVTGPTESVYQLYKASQRLSVNIAYVYEAFVEKLKNSDSQATIELVDSLEVLSAGELN